MITIALTATLLCGSVPQSPKPAACRISITTSPDERLNEDAFIGAVRDTIRAGSNGTSISLKWKDLDANGILNPEPIQDQLGIAKLTGGDVILSINPIDTSNRSMPDPLLKLKWDDPTLISRWDGFIEQLVPLIPKNVKAIALGNEVDVYLAAHPDEVQPFLNLMRNTRTYLRGAGFNCDFGTITTYEGFTRHRELVTKLHEPWSSVMMTYYPLDSNFQVLPPTEVAKDIGTMVKFAGSKPLMLTELGDPASSVCKSDEDKQSQFVTQAFASLRQHKSKIGWANFFMLHDFAPIQVQFLETDYRMNDEGFTGFLSSPRLKQANGKPRKAWTTFRKELSKWNDEHDSSEAAHQK